MNNNNVLEEFFVWEEKNSTDLNQNLLKNEKQDNCVTTIETKTDSMPSDWRTITDPKLRRKMSKRAWKSANKNKIQQSNATYRQKNKNVVRTKDRERKVKYYHNTKEKRAMYVKANRLQINQRQRFRSQHDVNFKLGRNLRTRLSSAIRNNQKIGSAIEDLGCTISELKMYLESKFQSGMTWDNYGFYGWHIDHIKPLAKFDLTDRKQFLEVCHYTNLQPLWAKDNLSKQDK